MGVLVFILGAVVGSFLNVVILRTWEGAEIVLTPSHCRVCKRSLQWYELIPIISFFVLRARCRTCHASISIQYPLVEIATGILFLAVVEKFGYLFFPVPYVILYFVFVSLLVILFVFDFKYLLIPDKFLYSTIAASACIALLGDKPFINYLLTAAIVSAAFAVMVYISKERAMGSGDIFLAVILGFSIGWPEIIPALIIAFFLGSIIGVALIVWGKKTLKTHIPFGPFLISALIVVWLWGERIVDWYLMRLGL